MKVTILFGSEADVAQLYSFPNSPECPWTLAETVQHWLSMTVARDGLTAKGARLSVGVGKEGVVVTVTGPDAIGEQLQQYAVRLPKFLSNGRDALTTVVPKIKSSGRWDPSPDPEPPTYHPWEFFLPHGMAVLNQRAVLFFHYPPIRLLRTNQDYLDDPVPVRCEELLVANGVAVPDLPLFNSVMDAAPIGAEDSQGSKKAGDKEFGLIPIQDFHDYQRAQVELLLNPSDKPGYTVPIVVYGAHPLMTFNTLYGTKLKNNQVCLAEIRPGQKTPVLASTHPYVFYGMAQGFDAIGSGKMLNATGATAQMIKDLVVARWLKSMSDDPTQDPHAVLKFCQEYWKDEKQTSTVTALVEHQGSLYYSDPTTLTFKFLVPLPTIGATAPAVLTPAVPPKPAAKAVAKSAPKPTAQGAKIPLIAKAQAIPSTMNVTTVMGDSGKPVDWWMIYKVSKDSVTTTRRAVTGAEYVYFDSVMAAQADAVPVLSPHRIDENGALSSTLAPLFGDAARANRDLGWYCYNDEDRHDPRGAGTGPADRGHCKGTLAFDLATDTGFWLIHSVPLFPLSAAFEYPATGLKMAQTMLCIQLADATTAMHIAQLMYDAHGPNVHLASDLLTKSSNQLYGYKAADLPLTDISKRLAKTDPRLQLMQNLNGSMGKKPKPYAGRVPFLSRGGQKFIAIAKNKAWGNAEDDPDGAKDFYNDLVAPTLNEDIEVETWENAGTKIPAAAEHGEVHKVENMQAADLSPLGIPYSWSEKVDHAKLAISDRSNAAGTDRWVCVGDINFTDAQERRGGGTAAFVCEPLWNSLVKVLTDQPEPARTPGAKKPAKASAK